MYLWTRDPAQAERIASTRENARYLAGVKVPEGVTVTADLARATEAAALVIAAPADGVTGLREQLGRYLRPEHCVLSATKGLAPDGGRRMSDLWAEAIVPARIAVLSGPNISREIAAGLPAPTVVASSDPETAKRFQSLVGTPMFRVYTNDDVIGVELCGALKNVIAIGAGAIDGIGYGGNAKAGFMTRGLAEIARFAFARGANPLTPAGLAGIGDLITTCTSPHSRNRTVGELLAAGHDREAIRERLGGQVAEGIGTTAAVVAAARTLGISMPIAEATERVLFDGLPVRDAMRELMQREQGEELAGPLAQLSRLLADLRSGPATGPDPG
ncbi:MAG: NAD(P)H-dependent glycerol-3-phosphate dehydrogenase [Candidatus Limnocylindrales bacterium]